MRTLLLRSVSALMCFAAAAITPATHAQTAMAIGGALKYDNEAVSQRLVALSGGEGWTWVVFGTAADDPAKSAGTIVDARGRDLGFEFRFRKGPDSLGHYSGAFGGEDYRVMNVVLDVVPVTLGRPLYRPLAPTAAAR